MKKYAIISVAAVVFRATAAFCSAKNADLAGSWYSDSPLELRAELEKYISDAKVGDIPGRIVAVIAPHAGTRFSGPVAGYSYKALEKQHPLKVIVIGFSHKYYLPGTVSVFTGDKFTTPLGESAVDTVLARKLMSCDARIKDIPKVFDGENSIELQIPFIQIAAKDAKLVLIAMTDQDIANCKALAGALYETLKDEKDFVIIASSDMSHYLTYPAAKARDGRTVRVIGDFNPADLYQESILAKHELLCGYGAVYTAMEAARRLGADKVRVLKYANSGDTSGMKDRVVGYMSAVFIASGDAPHSEASAVRTDTAPDVNTLPSDNKEEKPMYNEAQRKELLKIARETIKLYLETGKRYEPKVSDELLKADMGAFVTLHKKGELRGCIGHMIASGPLYLTVRDMAIAASTEDPRFAPVTASELKDIDLEISALSPMRKVAGPEEVKIPGNGVMVRMGWRSGVYLPQVADEPGWDKEEFMNSLCGHKAGIPMNAWKTGACDIYIFTAEVFGEKELGKE
jgi:hypothetical protein